MIDMIFFHIWNPELYFHFFIFIYLFFWSEGNTGLIPFGAFHANADPSLAAVSSTAQVESHSGDTFIGHSTGTKQEGGKAEL